MAEHIGFNIGVTVNDDSIKRADREAKEFSNTLEKIGSKADKLKVNNNLSKGLNGAKNAANNLNESAHKAQSTLEKTNGKSFEGIKKSADESAHSVGKLHDQIEKQLNQSVHTKVIMDGDQAETKTMSIGEKIKQLPRVIRSKIEAQDEASGPLEKIRQRFQQDQKEAQKTDHSIRHIAIGAAIGNGLSNMASGAWSGLKSMVSDGIRLNATVKNINVGFHNMGLSRRQIKGLDSQSQTLQKTLGLTGDQVANMQRQMMTYSGNNYRSAKRMTTAIGAIGAATRMPAQQVAQLSGQLMRVGASGKVTASSLTRITRNAPALYRVLAAGADTTVGKMQTMLKSGKVTQAQFQTWLANGAKTAPKYFKAFAKTAGGAANNISYEWRKLKRDITAPLMGTRQKGMTELASLMQSKAVQQGAHMLGVGMRNIAEWGMRGIGYIAKHRKDVVGIGSDFVKIAAVFAKQVWKDFTGIIFDLGKDFGLIKANAKPGSGLHSFRQAMDGLAKNRGAIQGIAHALELIAGLKGLSAVSKSVQNITDSLMGKKVTGVAVKAGDKLWGSRFAQGLRSASEDGKGAGIFNGALQSLKSAGSFHDLSPAGKITTGLAGASVVADAGASLVQAIKFRHSAKKRSEAIGKSLGTAVGGGIGMWFFGPAGAVIGAKIGKTVGKWGGHAVYKFTKGWQRKKPPKSFWSLEHLGWSAHHMWNGFTKSVSSTLHWFKKNWKIIGIYLTNPILGAYISLRKNKNFQKWVDGLTNYFKKKFGQISGWFNRNVVKPIDNFLSHIGLGPKHVNQKKLHRKAIKEMFPSHAAGTALVGEAGPELAYVPYARRARLLGANGPQLTKVKSNERILNARDTRKVISGGLGRGLVLRGYASGTEKLGQTTKTVTGDYKKISSNASRELNKLNKNSKQNWSQINRHTGKYTDKTRTSAVKDYSNMRKGVNKQMNALQSGVVSTAKDTSRGFGKALGKMDNYAHSSMKNTVKQLNQGIKGIDKVLAQFGGNNSVINTIHFAAGSDSQGRLTHNTLAMVNDASTGPRQEALVSPHNDLVIPHGNNRRMVIGKGWGVLNGQQTQSVAHSMGLQHFASGSGMSHSQLRKLADKGQSNPSASFKDMYTSHVQASGTDLNKGTTNLGKHASTHYGVPWTEAVWSVIENAIGGANGKGGTREAFLKYAERTFSGVRYVMGAASRTASDCSGMVMQALRHFGINIGRTTVAMQNSSGVQYLGKSLSKTVPGDLVIYGHGTGAAGHVGIIKNPRTHSMFNETPPRARVTSIDAPKAMGYGYYRVKGLHNAKTSKKTQKADSRLERLAKQELGKSTISWIKKHLGESFGSLGSFSLGGDIGDRARALAGGLKKLDPRATRNGIAAILGNWEFESGGLNPNAVNSGGGASGLGQWLGGRLANLKAYARRHGKSWKSPALQLEFALKGDTGNTGILRSVLEGHGSVASLATKFSRLWERGGFDAQHVHGAMIVRKALGYKNGGDVTAGRKVIVGEHGPELAEFKQPAHIYDHATTKEKLSFDKVKSIVGKPKHIGRTVQMPAINININGPISSTRTANKYADMMTTKIEKVLEQMADTFGTDPSVY